VAEVRLLAAEGLLDDEDEGGTARSKGMVNTITVRTMVG
jgi:hypothetical protein